MPTIDHIATVRSYGFRVDPLEEFRTTCTNSALVRRASTYDGSHVMWDPDDNEDGFLLVGDDPEELAKDWVDDRPDEVILTFKTEL